jgi:peptidoglycan hydrolase-like protein with peptidoglycan-binding domain
MLSSRRLGSEPQLQNASRQAPLARGAKGPGVAALQDLLVDLGFDLPKTMAKGKADGIYGAETEAAVKEFQSGHNLKPDGMAGPLTLAALDALIGRFPALETPDPAAEGAATAKDFGRPLGKRGSSYW